MKRTVLSGDLLITDTFSRSWLKISLEEDHFSGQCKNRNGKNDLACVISCFKD